MDASSDEWCTASQLQDHYRRLRLLAMRELLVAVHQVLQQIWRILNQQSKIYTILEFSISKNDQVVLPSNRIEGNATLLFFTAFARVTHICQTNNGRKKKREKRIKEK